MRDFSPETSGREKNVATSSHNIINHHITNKQHKKDPTRLIILVLSVKWRETVKDGGLGLDHHRSETDIGKGSEDLIVTETEAHTEEEE